LPFSITLQLHRDHLQLISKHHGHGSLPLNHRLSTDNFLQRHNGDFTPFSIPLYEIVSPEDAAELTEIIAEKVKLTRLPQA